LAWLENWRILQWRDCKRAIQGFVGAQFKGFQTLDGAEEAVAGGNAAY
jgi:viroplasmin and RNaseH domain-containing protein